MVIITSLFVLEIDYDSIKGNIFEKTNYSLDLNEEGFIPINIDLPDEKNMIFIHSILIFKENSYEARSN